MTLLPKSSSAAMSEVGARGLPRSTKRATSGKPAHSAARGSPGSGGPKMATLKARTPSAMQHHLQRGGQRLRQRVQRERLPTVPSSRQGSVSSTNSRSFAGVSEANNFT